MIEDAHGIIEEHLQYKYEAAELPWLHSLGIYLYDKPTAENHM